jgi:uncharacterized protein YbjT (DUF2867 family)
MKILVTGGTGTLGQAFTKQAIEKNIEVRIASRRPPQKEITEWSFLDLETGEGLQNALMDVDIVLHTATSPLKNSDLIDVQGTKNLVESCKEHHIKHLLFPSIVGIESLPLPYYQSKMKAENIIKESGVPYTIMRSTQFHSLIDKLFHGLTKFPISFLPTQFKCQSVDVDEVASAMLDLCQVSPQGSINDFGGPEILTFKEMFSIWKQYRKRKTLMIPLPSIPLALFKAIEEGKNTNIEQKKGRATWAQWVKDSSEAI